MRVEIGGQIVEFPEGMSEQDIAKASAEIWNQMQQERAPRQASTEAQAQTMGENRSFSRATPGAGMPFSPLESGAGFDYGSMTPQRASRPVLSEAEQLEQENLKFLERRLAWQNANSPLERAKLMAQNLVPKAGEMAKSVAVEGGSAGVGQVVGQRVAGTPGRMAGGAVGGATGSIANQIIDRIRGTRDSFSPGEVVANAVAGALTTQGAKRNAGVNVAAETVRALIDEKTLPSMEGVTQAAAIGYIAGKVSQKISGKELTPPDALLQYRNDTFRALRKDGVVVNPQELQRRVGGLATIAGEVPLNAASSMRNQYVWQKLTRQELGIDNKPLPLRRTTIDAQGRVVKGDLDLVIERASKPYEQVRNLSQQAAQELESFHKTGKPLRLLRNKTQEDINLVLKANDNLDQLKKIRTEIRDAGAAMKRGEPDAYKTLQAAKAAEQAIEDQLERAAAAVGRPRLVRDVKEARVTLSKAFAVRDAVNDVTGLVDVNELANMRATPSRPGRMLTGNLAKMADFAEAFGRNAVEAVNAAVDRPSAVSLNYATRQIAMGRMSGPLAAGVPFLSEGAKNVLLTDMVQNQFTRPRFMPSPATDPSIAVRNALMVFGRQSMFDQNAEPVEDITRFGP